MKVPFALPDIGEEEADLAREVILSRWVTQGPMVERFEREFAAYVGAEHAIATSSCTTALHLALVVAGVGPGDEVIVPALSFIATANAVLHAGARPAFADIDPATLNLDATTAACALGPRTKAVLAVHQVGRPADLDGLRRFCSEHRLALLEDAACASGSEYQGRRIGGNQHSPLVCFSFHPRKLLTTGDGGMITTGDGELAARLRRLRQHGMSVNDLARHRSTRIIAESYDELGYNYRLTDLQAALGVAQLAKLPVILAARRRLAARYDALLAGHPVLALFREPPGSAWNHQTYLVRLRGVDAARRDAVMQLLLDREVATRRGIMSIHREKPYTDRPGPYSLPHSEQASDQCLCLPLFGGLTDQQQDHVVASLRELVT